MMQKLQQIYIQKVKKYADMALYEEILFLKHNIKGGWVVENVKPYYTPLIPPKAIFSNSVSSKMYLSL